MTIRLFASAAALLLLLAATPHAVAQGSPGPGAAPAQEESATKPKRTRKKREGASKELNVNQMAASERRKKCSAEWKEAKAGDRTNGLKWPKFYSQCNARLKGNSA